MYCGNWNGEKCDFYVFVYWWCICVVLYFVC